MREFTTSPTLETNAVYVRNAVKQFGSKKHPYLVLNGLNMVVPKGSIYGLLGSSGCGKTTLLNCIVGRMRLNSGEIRVLGGTPGSRGSGIPGRRIGYMPQATALYMEFTIKETFKYFGWINEMKAKAVNERMDFFIELLMLPPANTLIKNLSNGQQRRVSLAVALIHDAELLILDEPTVGIDPMIRASIWEYLILITKREETTIIITTHYVQETINANKIAFLRGGYLLAETSPAFLLKKFNSDSLEEVFLNLSELQNMRMSPRVKNVDSLYRDIDAGGLQRKFQEKELTETEEYTSVNLKDAQDFSVSKKCNGNFFVYNPEHLNALIWKNFLWMWRNCIIVLCIISVPVCQVLMFCFAIGHDSKNLSLAVVNYELDTGAKCNYTFDCNSKMQSCVYLSYLKTKSYVIQAREVVLQGKSWASLTFTRGYSQTIEKRLTNAKYCSDEEFFKSQIDVHQDLSDINIGHQVMRDIHDQFILYAKNYVKNCTDYHSPLYFFEYQEPIYGSRVPSYSDSAIPGVILTVTMFMACALTIGTLLMERIEGTLERLLVNGVTALEILSSQIITQFTIVFCQEIFVLVLALYIFQIMQVGPVYLAYLLIVLTGICGMAFGFAVASFVDTERTATYVTLGSFLPNIILCGIIWPVEGMPFWLRQITCFLPLTKCTQALKAILHRGWNIQYYDVYIGFISISIWCVIFLILSVLGLKFRKK